jgi:hypothetical protein
MFRMVALIIAFGGGGGGGGGGCKALQPIFTSYG